MILLSLLYLSLCSSNFALPTHSELSTDIPLSLFTRSADIFGTRSIWGIIWSCFSTIFACTWIAVHPNIPGPKDSVWVVLGKRVAIMGYILMAPEMVIVWAARQHIGARRLTEQYCERGWTRTHGFFLIMGGFTLYDEKETALRVLLPEEFEKLSQAGKIAWPSITEEEIQDRSKGDYLSKGIVLGQTSWFIVQCIVRCTYGLEITELEVATLAFAALTGVTYYLWWHKPLDVRCSVAVYLIKESPGGSEDSPNPQQPLIVIPNDSEATPTQGPTMTFTPSHNNSTSNAEPNSTALMQRFSAFIRKQHQKHGTFLGLIHVFLLDPPLAFFRPLYNMGTHDTFHNSSPLRVPTFYAPEYANDFYLVVATSYVGVIFGGIHCIAWSFHFPTFQERLAWRISAAFVTGFPILLIALVSFDDFNNSVNVVQDSAMSASAVIYIIARIILLVLPCIALRALPAAAFVDIQWASFIPHIG